MSSAASTGARVATAATTDSPFAPSGTLERLSIDHLDVFDAEDRFWTQYQVDHDAKAFGAQWAAFARASVFPTMAAALEGGRADPRSDEFMTQLEAGVAARMAAQMAARATRRRPPAPKAPVRTNPM